MTTQTIQVPIDKDLFSRAEQTLHGTGVTVKQLMESLLADHLVSYRPSDNAASSISSENDVSRRIGIAKGKFTVYGDFDADNDEIAAMLMDGDI
ncbi:MAG: hypothetical protein IKR73_09285 [Oscillospiraceae bacterium]|nr:hypothetical protein [Oscillospiraceae bacterium]